MDNTNPPLKNAVLSVSQLNRLARNTLEDIFSGILVQGEISELLQHRSGHWYFTLKDNQSQIRVAMFRSANARVKFSPNNGQLVQLKGQLSIYEARGSYQFIATSMEPEGTGKLLEEFERLKKALSAEGLFSLELKKELPAFPVQVALITSPQGAAVGDMLTTFNRRHASVEPIVVPVAVQGDGSGEQIAQTLDACNRFALDETSDFKPDVLIVGRGGGSLEDLWAFNEEVVARAIARSRIPVVSAVGHEVDFTIADLAADVRAATPTAAAELVCPDASHLRTLLHSTRQRIALSLSRKLNELALQLRSVHRQLEHPAKKIQQQNLKLDSLDTRLNLSMQATLIKHDQELNTQVQRLTQHSPANSLERLKLKLTHCQQRQMRAVNRIVDTRYKQFESASTALNIVSPLATISRGFSITLKNKSIVRSINQIEPGETIETKVGDGLLYSVVNRVDEEKK